MKTIRFVNVQAVLSKFVSVVAESDNKHEVEGFGRIMTTTVDGV